MENRTLVPIYAEVYEAEDWESLVCQGLEAREQKDNAQWELGKLADKVNVKYGQDSVGVFASSIGVNKRTLLRYRDVHRGFKNLRRDPVLSFSHHLKALGTDNPQEWLDKASEGNWSVEKLGLEIEAKSGITRKLKCKTCGGVMDQCKHY